jgi:hypothetical protein
MDNKKTLNKTGNKSDGMKRGATASSKLVAKSIAKSRAAVVQDNQFMKELDCFIKAATKVYKLH